MPARAVLRVGGRYRFTMFGKPATLRLLVQNVTEADCVDCVEQRGVSFTTRHGGVHGVRRRRSVELGG